MEKGNVLVLGNSGVGKSTLINTVLGENVAVTGCGPTGTTKELKIYESKQAPFRLIDSVGFEPSPFKAHQAISAVRHWTKGASSPDNKDALIDMIWFCVDGTSRKLFPQAIKALSRATSIWKTVPFIVVITKSYSEPDRQSNIDMVNQAFSEQKHFALYPRHIIPVVAEAYFLNDQAFAPPAGITELIDATLSLMPEGIRAAQHDMDTYLLNRKRAMAHSVVAAATVSGTAVAAAPIPIPDAAILTPLELAEVSAISRIYGISKNESADKFIHEIVNIGAVATAGKTALVFLKSLPVFTLSAAAANALIAGSIIAILGESSIYAFEQIYLGNKTLDDIDWVKNLIESKFASSFLGLLQEVVSNISPEDSTKTIAQKIMSALFASISDNAKKK